MPFIRPFPIYENPSGDGRDLVLDTPLYYIGRDGTQYRTIIGATTDGASTPSPIWSFIPPEDGPWFLPAVLHDGGYRCMLEILDTATGVWKRIMLTKEQNDDLLNEAMEDNGVDKVRRILIYEGVKLCGDNAFSEDLAQPIPK